MQLGVRLPDNDWLDEGLAPAKGAVMHRADGFKEHRYHPPVPLLRGLANMLHMKQWSPVAVHVSARLSDDGYCVC